MGGESVTKELTPRQKELLKYIKEDPWITGKELASKMKIKPKSVKWYITSVFKILECKQRRDLVKKLNKMRV